MKADLMDRGNWTWLCSEGVDAHLQDRCKCKTWEPGEVFMNFYPYP